VDEGNTINMTMKIEGKPEATALRQVIVTGAIAQPTTTFEFVFATEKNYPLIRHATMYNVYSM
jgi:hypothetical protein